MATNAGMLAGSHNRNEFFTIRNEGELGPKPLKNINTKVCQILGDTVGVTASGDVFVACNECAFPVCQPCYEYERKVGNQSCPQCKTRYRRHKGSARVAGDDEEEDFDDLENEFNYVNGNGKSKQQWKMHGQGKNVDISSSISDSQHPIPLLTNGLQWIAGLKLSVNLGHFCEDKCLGTVLVVIAHQVFE